MQIEINGKVFNTITDAADHFGINPANLRSAHFNKGSEFEYKVKLKVRVLGDKKLKGESTEPSEIAKIGIAVHQAVLDGIEPKLDNAESNKVVKEIQQELQQEDLV